ncbi:type II toxin-antitoxin system CcdA family antitoxin [Scandinavium goeteborgense]|jgi:antitoxin CcdA|uniref:type II toxin-antitoxin system CcdA family antitoxin n=1 Tax=Scandinavium goeteborgense TaxID=1851514 RepID=UPI000D7C233D
MTYKKQCYEPTLTVELKPDARLTEAERWKQENNAGLHELNQITDDHGLLSDDYPTF